MTSIDNILDQLEGEDPEAVERILSDTLGDLAKKIESRKAIRYQLSQIEAKINQYSQQPSKHWQELNALRAEHLRLMRELGG